MAEHERGGRWLIKVDHRTSSETWVMQAPGEIFLDYSGSGRWVGALVHMEDGSRTALEIHSCVNDHPGAFLIDGLLDVVEQQQREIWDLQDRLEEAQLRSIEARNPGIDIEEVRRARAGG